MSYTLEVSQTQSFINVLVCVHANFEEETWQLVTQLSAVATKLYCPPNTQAVERFSRGWRHREQVNGGQWEEPESDDDDDSSRLLDEAVKEHLISTSTKT